MVSRRFFLSLTMGAATAALLPAPMAEAAVDSIAMLPPGTPGAPERYEEPAPRAAKTTPTKVRERAIWLHNTHTNETFRGVYWSGGRYNKQAMLQLSRFMRDHYTGKVRPIAPGLIDVLHAIQQRARAKGPVHVVSGYRSPSTNAMLASYDDGVATNSQHVLGKAADIRIEGVRIHQLGKIAAGLKAGGVGTYPGSGFVHVDVGKVRRW